MERDYTLARTKIHVWIHDCPRRDSQVADCETVGDVINVVDSSSIPPSGQTRSLTMNFVFANLPEPKGMLIYTWELQ